MGTVTDPTVDETKEDAPNPSGGGGNSNGVHDAPSEETKTPAIEFSPAPPAGIRRASTAGTGFFSALSGGGNGPSNGLPRHSSGSGIPRYGSGSGIPRHGSGIPRQGSGSVGGGIHRARSGVHLPSLTSISFSMSRLPEEDAGMQMHFTTMKDPVDTVPESAGDDDDESTPKKPKNRMRKHLTAVGACSFGFRLAECVLSLIAFIIMCANSQSMGPEFGTFKFTHFQAYKYLVAVNIIVFVYSTLQFIQLLYTVILGISFIPSILLSTWLTFAFDQLFCYLLLSASTSAATVANMSYTGEMGVRFCSRYDLGSFCARADAAVTMSFFTFLAMLSSTILAIYRIAVLLREY